MNVNEFTSLLQDPGELEASRQTRELEEVLHAYPWFQPARALYLKGLHKLGSYKYNQALKATAAATADREVLFDYITSEEFLQDSIAQTLTGRSTLADTEIISETVVPDPERETEMLGREPDSPLPRSAKEADRILDPGLFHSLDPEVDEKLATARRQARESLELGRPLEFTRKERYSFSEWLQITTLKKPGKTAVPADKGADSGPEPIPGEAQDQPDPQEAQERKRKFERIDRFIQSNPKIVPDKSDEGPRVDIESSVKLDKKELMTETLARVYLEQGKYKKAIQAYRILSLKYPEKSGFFADQIKAVEQLRRDKSK